MMHNPSGFILRLLLCLVILSSLTGCEKKVTITTTTSREYLEQPTPPGQVPPPAAAPQPTMPYRNPRADREIVAPAPPGSHGASTLVAAPLMDEAVVEQFRPAYRARKSPRLAIFLNRELSDEVREWQTDSRSLIVAKGERQSSQGGQSDSATGQTEVATFDQAHLENPGREAPAGESWMWGFEDGFVNAFLDAGATIIDRATIMRLAAADSGRQGSSREPIAMKMVEIEALRGKADLFLEVLVQRDPAAQMGYIFKATAKEVGTGAVHALVTSRSWAYHLQGETTEKVVATSSGYDFVEETTPAVLPDVTVLSRDLALALMDELEKTWRR